jgi:hypothetical protein
LELEDFEEYIDMIEAADMIPQYAFRVVVGFDKDSQTTLCVNRVGTIETMTLLGVFETLKARIMEA